MVTIDSKALHPTVAGESSVPFVPASSSQKERKEFISTWSAAQQIQPGKYVIDDYDFKAPGADLIAVRRPENTPTYQKADYEVFDYPGLHDTVAEGEAWLAGRIEELHCKTTLYEGSGLVNQFGAGFRFKPTDHPRADQN